MRAIKKIFKPNYERYEGVRLINIFLLRLFFLLITIFVANDSWSTIFAHEGEWDHLKAAAVCMWASYSVLLVFGLYNPLKWLPVLMFIIFYKLIWLFTVAYPLWSTNNLLGSVAEEMAAEFFVAVIVLIIIMPWSYVLKTYIWPMK